MKAQPATFTFITASHISPLPPEGTLASCFQFYTILQWHEQITHRKVQVSVKLDLLARLTAAWLQNNQALQFSASCVNENAPSLFMTSNKAGTQSGLICSWMREARETAACLACVWVTELVRDGGWEGTSGPQLVYHSLSLLPAAITSGRLGQDQGLVVCLSV